MSTKIAAFSEYMNLIDLEGFLLLYSFLIVTTLFKLKTLSNPRMISKQNCCSIHVLKIWSKPCKKKPICDYNCDDDIHYGMRE